jgi:hypothetical protein
MHKSITAVLLLFSAIPAFAQSSDKTLAEWQRLRPLLREQGYPVMGLVQTREQMAQDMERVRREMERRQGRAPSENLSRVGGGGGAAPQPVVPRKVELRSKIKK